MQLTISAKIPDPTFAEPIRIASNAGSDTYWVLLTYCSHSYGMEINVSERNGSPFVTIKRNVNHYLDEFDKVMEKEMDYLMSYFKNTPAKTIDKFLRARRKVLTEVYFGF